MTIRLRPIGNSIMGGMLGVLLCLGAPSGAHAQSGSEGAFNKFDQQVLDAKDARHWPGAIWAVVQDGKVVHLGSAGVANIDTGQPIDGDTIFRIASMSKAFTALAILKLRDEGKLSLDAPAETYVPEMKGWSYPTTDSPRITVRDLLSHVAGFATDDPWGDRQQNLSEADFTAMLRNGITFQHAPEAQFEYSNLGYALLGRIVTNVSGKQYDDYIMAEVMHPLGMTSSGYDIFAAPQDRRALGYRWEEGEFVREPDLGRGAFGAMGGVWTTANDYVKWVAFLQQAWPARDGLEVGPVQRSTVRELAQGMGFLRDYGGTPLKEGDPCTSIGIYGKGMIAYKDCALGFTLTHSGGYPGYGSNVRILPDNGLASFVFTNRTYGGPSTANREGLVELARAGMLDHAPAVSVSSDLALAYDLMRAAWHEGSLAPLVGRLAMNVPLDKSIDLRTRDLVELRDKVGTCDSSSGIEPNGRLSGNFHWACANGSVDGTVLLTSVHPVQIQSFRFAEEGAGSQ